MLVKNFHTISFLSGGKLFTSDLDGTMLIPKGGQEENIRKNLENRAYDEFSFFNTIESFDKAGIDDVHIATGRNPTEFFGELKSLFTKVRDSKISAISLDDGNILLRKPSNMTSDEWLKQLFSRNINPMSFSDPKWSEKVAEPIYEIKNYLTQQGGFIHHKNDGENLIFRKNIDINDPGAKKVNGKERWNVVVSPPGIVLKIGTLGCDDNSDINLQEYNEYLSGKIFDYLKGKNIDISNYSTSQETFYVDKFERKDINKGAVADYYAECRGKNDDEQIRAGNSSNDVSLLSNDNIKSIFVGDDEAAYETIAQKRTTPLIRTASGELGKKLNCVA